MEEGNQRVRESNPLWFFEDTHYESQRLMRPLINEAKWKLLRKMPWLLGWPKRVGCSLTASAGRDASSEPRS